MLAYDDDAFETCPVCGFAGAPADVTEHVFGNHPGEVAR